MKKLCLLIVSTFFFFSVFAQLEKGYVYLKNGTILKGKYLFADDGKKLRLNSAGNMWVFSSEEIDSVSSLNIRRQQMVQEKTTDTHFFYRTEIGVLAGNAENSQSAPFAFSASGNYAITPSFSAGVGFGIEFLKESYLPAFINLEYKVRNSYATPYFFLKAGCQIAIEESRAVYYDYYPAWSSIWPGPNYNKHLAAKGGILLNPGLGFQRMFSSNIGMSMAFGYQFHRLKFDGENDYGLEIDYNRLTIKLGIIFN